MSASFKRRKEAARIAAENFSMENGFSLSDCQSREVDLGHAIQIIYTAPDGREFHIGVIKGKGAKA